jgi:predicted alpha-1,2-mannosidase
MGYGPVTRRTFVGRSTATAIGVAAVLALLIGLIAQTGLARGAGPATTAPHDYVHYVRPWIGSNTGRWFQTVSACQPFGMIGITPDTELRIRFGGGGYVYKKTDICGFSHLHGWGLAAILVMPTVGGIDPASGPDGWKSPHRHANEVMTAGYHKVVLDRYNITAEITATARAGMHRWTFGSDGAADIFFDLHSPLAEANQTNAKAVKVGDREIAGWVHMQAGYEGASPDVGKVYFVARFNRPFASLRAWQKTNLGAVDAASGHPLLVYPRFLVSRGDALEMKIGISFCSAAQARKNLDAEIGSRDFSAVKAQSRAEWNQWLGKVDVTGGSEEQRIKFYTDVWHSLFGRQTLNDADGCYFDRMSNRIRQLPLCDGKPRHRVFNSDAFWWTMWNLNVWWGLAYPSVLEEWVHDSLLWYDNDPKHRIPWGNVNGGHSWVMLGAERTPLICHAAQMGMTGFDREKAYAALRQMHTSARAGGNGWLDGIDDYLALGYVAADSKIRDCVRSASLTVDDAYTDWVLAQLAKRLGHQADYDMFMRRAANWKNLWDGHYIRPRYRDGRWANFNPLIGTNKGYCEANAEQYSFFAVHDVPGMANLMGGFDKFTARLDADFRQAEPARFAFAEGQNGSEGTINYANQPNLQAAHLFNYAGKPWRSQYWARRVLAVAYGSVDASGGYAYGDEDQGQLGALSALLAIGLFSLRGGCEDPPIYEITAPIFDTITIRLDPKYCPAKQFVIKTYHNSPANHYIQAAKLDGRPLQNCWIFHHQLAAGKTLELWLGPQPNPRWGVAVPPCNSTARTIPP